ncbi:response regulator transcription factor [Cytobacillus sp. IB215665]|uniref:response regulator transcription factor n=1 Tax=Cytobacillus sp. IB215665 TaxID=3097357 RepID=UPI002A0DE975|nr:response regulator transcription factor [Cytobacillus sp. IB215665]MDX8365466.1 response regulator transcription factor [Cytobacillus sp. IB215665]
MEAKILVVEDDLSISEMVEEYLIKEGYSITTAYDGREAERILMNNEFDLILLDIMLPQLNGIDLLKIIREKSTIPILIMSAKDSDVDKALGLGFGADDYIAKPFSMIELSARVQAAIRRAKQYSQNRETNETKIVKYNGLKVDLNNFSVSKDGKEIKLTSKEFHILKLFISHPNRVFTKEQIYQLIWDDGYLGDENIINVHMRRLREKIEENPSSPIYIKTLWGIGYKLGDF